MDQNCVLISQHKRHGENPLEDIEADAEQDDGPVGAVPEAETDVQTTAAALRGQHNAVLD